MKLTLLLADAAQVDVSHKIHALGLGWSRVTSPLPPIAIVLFVEFERGELDVMPTIYVRLIDDSGELAQTAEGSLMFRFVPEDAEIDPKAKEAAQGVIPFIVQIGPGLSLAPGRFKFVAEIQGQDVVSERAFEVIGDQSRT